MAGLMRAKRVHETRAQNAFGQLADAEHRRNRVNDRLEQKAGQRRLSSAATGAGIGFSMGGPVGAAIGAGVGLLANEVF